MKSNVPAHTPETANEAESTTRDSAEMRAVPDELVEAMARARQEPESDEAWDAIDELARSTQKPEPISALYREVLGGDLPVGLVHRLGQRAADFHEEWFADPTYVIGVLSRVLEIDPQADWAFERLSLLLTMAERWEDLLATYDRALAASEDVEHKKKLLDEAARIAKDFAGETNRAINYLKELVPLRPEDAQLASSLERRLTLQKRYRDLIDVWTARLGVMEGDEALRTRVQIAETWLDKLEDAETSLSAVREILQMESGQDEACRLLEKIGVTSGAPREVRRAALSMLHERFSSAERSADAVRAIDLRLEVADADDERIALRSEAMDRLAALDRLGEAVAHGAELLVLSPSRKTRDRLLELVAQTGQFGPYVGALVRAAAETTDESLRVELLAEAGRICQETLEEPVRAIDLLSRVLSDGAADETARLDAARRLKALLIGEEHADKRLEVLEKLAGLEPEAEDRRQVLGEAARLAERLGRDDHALGLWRVRLETDPSDQEALDATVVTVERLERWGALVGALRDRAEASGDPALKRSDLVRIANVHEQRLSDVEAAIEVWQEIQAEFGQNAETVDSLARLSAEARRWTDVVELLRSAAKDEGDPVRRADQHAQMGDVYREQRASPAKAVASYGEALEIDPRHEQSRAGLRRLLDDPEAGREAVETLAKACSTAAEWSSLLDLAEKRLAVAPNDTFRKDVLLEAAWITEEQLHDPSAALGFQRRAFAVAPEPAVEKDLVRLAEATGRWEEAAEGYRQAIEQCTDDDRKRELLYERGQILESRLEDRAAALDAYTAIVEGAPGHLPAACAVARVGGQIGRWDAAAHALIGATRARAVVEPDLTATFESVLQGMGGWDEATAAVGRAIDRSAEIEPQLLHDLLRQLALWHRDRREDFDAAEATLDRAATAHVEPTTLLMLAELQRRRPGRPLVDTLLKLADATREDLDTLHEAGSVALLAVGDRDLARPILERVLSVASERWRSGSESGGSEERYSLWALEELVRLSLEAGTPQRATELLIRGAALPVDPDKSRQFRYRAARIASTDLGDSAQAVELCRGILEEAPDHQDAILLLGAIYSEEGRLEELLALRKQELGLEPPVERRLEIRLDIARVLEELDADSNERIAVLSDNLADRPGHDPSIDRLAGLLEAASRHDELYRLLSDQAEKLRSLDEATAAASLWARAARLAEDPLNDVRRALAAYKSSVELDPALDVLDALARIHTGAGEHEAAVVWLQQRLARTTRSSEDPSEYRDAVLRLARAHHSAEEEDQARRVLTDALADDPSARALRDFLADLYRAGESWQLLAPLLAEGVDYTDDVADKVALLSEAAGVRRRRLGDLQGAIPLLQRAVELSPQDRGPRLALADALRRAERYDDARQLLEGLLEEFGRRRTPERAAVHYHLARIARAQGNLSEALEQLESASSIERGDPKILRLLGDVARQNGEPDRAERAYRALMLIVRRQQPPEAAEADDDAIAASEVMYDLYRIAYEAGHTDRANDLLESAFETASENNFEALRLERALSDAGQTDLVLRVLDTRLGRIEQPDAAAEILRAKAELLAGLDRLDEALDTLLEALERTPESTILLGAAQDFAKRSGALERYVERVNQVAERIVEANPAAAGMLWLKLGGLAEEELQDSERAAGFYERALGTGVRPLRAFRALERVLPEEATERKMNALVRFVAAPEPEGADPTARTNALYRLAEIELSSRELAGEGAQHLKEALERNVDLRRALDMLRRGIEVAPDEPLVVEVFERVARDLGDEQLLLEALMLRAALPDASFDLLRDAVALAREQRDDENLFLLLGRLVEVARREDRLGEVVWALTELAARRETEGDHRGAVDLLREASRATETGEAFEFDLRVAELSAGPLDDPRLAAETYERLLEAEPSEPRVYRPLLDVYRRLGEREKIETCISNTVEAVYDPGERNHLRMERGRILLEDPNRIEEAESVLREVLDEDPEHTQASLVLAELLEQTGRVDELGELLSRQLEVARDSRDGDAVAALALRIGRGRSREEAIELYEDALVYAEANRDLLEALLSLYGPDYEVNDRARVMEKLLAVEAGDRAATLALDLADLWQSLEDEDAVERALSTGFLAAPTHAALRERLTSFYSARQDWERLAELFVSDADRRANTSEALGRYRDAARLFTERLGDPGRAADVLTKAHDAAPEDLAVLSELVDAFRSAARAHEALEIVGRAVDRASGRAQEQADLLATRASLRVEARDPDLETLSESVADLDAARSLVDSGYEKELASLLEQQRARAADLGDEATERAATMRLASVLPKIGEQRRGLELLVGWVKRKPDDADAVRGLGQFAADAEKWGAAAKAYQRLVEITEASDQVDAAIRLAEACEKAGAPMDARETLERVYAANPGNDMLRAQLRRMYEAAEAYEQLATILIAEAEQATEDETKAARLVEAGELSLRVEGGERTAVEAFRRAFDLNPADHRAVIKLADTLAQVGEIEEAANLLDQSIAAHEKKRSPELSELQHSMARVGRVAEDYEAVFAWLEAAIQTDRQNGAAAADLAVLAMEHGELEMAIKALQAITLLKSPGPMSRAEAYLRQGMIAEQKGDRRKAIFLAKRALTSEPDYEDAKAFLAQIEQ